MLDLGVCDVTGGLNVYPRNGCSVKVSKLNGAAEMLVDGGVLVVAANDALPSNCVLRLFNGGKVRLECSGTLRLNKMFVNGSRVPFGVYDAENSDWIDAGSGSVTTGSPLRIIFRCHPEPPLLSS